MSRSRALVRESSKGTDDGSSVGDLADVKECKDGSVEQSQDDGDECMTDNAGIFTECGIAAPVAEGPPGRGAHRRGSPCGDSPR